MHMWAEDDDADSSRQKLLQTAVESLRVLIDDDRRGRQWP
jgi:hypothetical protein